jgi:REP element-mobilizing transposase RayT
MPRASRIDAPGALHHVTARGIERRRIFETDADRGDFLRRLGTVLPSTGTDCLAWCLIPDHFHLLLETGQVHLSTVMRRLLTGYAAGFNRRRGRKGPLFAGRYKSVLCQEETFLLPLVRHLHLNPFRAGLVEGLEELEDYPYAGHRALLGKAVVPWQDTGRVLGRFGGNGGSAQARYRTFVARGAALGPQPHLIGGGLVRSAGGWSRVKALRRRNADPVGDERILGDSAFVERTLARAGEHLERRTRRALDGITLERVAAGVADLWNVDVAEVWAPGKQRRRVEARSVLCYWAVRELGFTMTALARRLGLSVPAVSKSVLRGERLMKERDPELRDTRPLRRAGAIRLT